MVKLATATLYYADNYNLPEMKRIINMLHGEGITIKRAKKAVKANEFTR